MSYKEKFTLKNRIEESTRIKEKYPDKLPVIVDKHRSSTAPAIDKKGRFRTLDVRKQLLIL